MTRFMAGIVMRGGRVLTQDSVIKHVELAEIFGLDDFRLAYPTYARVELVPPERGIEDVDKWTWGLLGPLDDRPGWFDEEEEAAAEKVMRSRARLFIDRYQLRDEMESVL